MLKCFNPHTHAGCDEINPGTHDIIDVSIHTPTQGVTSVYRGGDFCNNVSIHTPTQGVTSPIWGDGSQLLVSIHTPTQGVTGNNAVLFSVHGFQSTHPRRV